MGDPAELRLWGACPRGRDGEDLLRNLLGASSGLCAFTQRSGWEKNNRWAVKPTVVAGVGESLRLKSVSVVVKRLSTLCWAKRRTL